MAYKVAIRKNETGEIRIIPLEIEWNDSSHFWWTEGNYCCDCNREAEFYGDDDDAPEDTKCSDGRYSVLYAELEDGTRIAIDEDSP